MVEINTKISERDDTTIDVVCRASLYAPYSGYETEIAKFLVPMLNDMMLKIREQFPTKVIRITEMDSPLNEKIKPVDKPWEFPRRGDLI